MMACRCYHAERNFIGKIGVCWGTKECEPCSCGGDESRCDFYDYVRDRASKPQSNGDRIRASTDEELAWAYAYRLASCYGCEASTMEECAKCTMDWLRQETEEGAGTK